MGRAGAQWKGGGGKDMWRLKPAAYCQRFPTVARSKKTRERLHCHGRIIFEPISTFGLLQGLLPPLPPLFYFSAQRFFISVNTGHLNPVSHPQILPWYG